MSTPQRAKLQAASWFSVVRAYQECNRRYSQLLSGFDLTIPQFDVLTAIRTLGESATPKAIADRLVVTRGNITGVLHRLQDRALISTHQHDCDGRSFVCGLTELGQATLQQARNAASIFIEQQLAPFDDGALRETECMMNRMQSHLQSIEPDSIVASVLGEPGNLPEKVLKL